MTVKGESGDGDVDREQDQLEGERGNAPAKDGAMPMSREDSIFFPVVSPEPLLLSSIVTVKCNPTM